MDNHMSAHRFFVNESGILTQPMPTVVQPEALLQLNLF